MTRPILASLFKSLLALLCAGLLMAPLGITCGVQDDYNRQVTGVSFAAQDGMVNFAQGQAVGGQVVNPAALAKQGLPGVNKGDAIEARWQGGQRFTYTHPSSGRSVTIVFPKDKVVIRSR